MCIRDRSYMGSPRGFMDRSRRLEVAIPAFVMIVGSMLLGMVFMSPMLEMCIRDRPACLRLSASSSARSCTP